MNLISGLWNNPHRLLAQNKLTGHSFCGLSQLSQTDVFFAKCHPASVVDSFGTSKLNDLPKPTNQPAKPGTKKQRNLNCFGEKRCRSHNTLPSCATLVELVMWQRESFGGDASNYVQCILGKINCKVFPLLGNRLWGMSFSGFLKIIIAK